MGDFWDYVKPKGAAVFTGDALEDSETGEGVVGFGQALLQVVLNVTGCEGGAVDDKLDVYVDRRAAGGAWVNAAHFPQVAGNAAVKKFVAFLDHRLVTAVPAVTTTDYSADAAANAVRPTVQGEQLRARVVTTKVSNPVAAWSFTVDAYGE